MTPMLRIICVVATAFVPLAHATAQERLTVVELFTSQGCSTCPPADALLADLAERGDILALSTHVDYWDYLGWKDSFASAETTARQRAYADKLGLGYVYTPQMVIQGETQEVGSHRREVLERIAQVDHSERVDVKIRPDLSKRAVIVSLPAEQTDDGSSVVADVWLFLLDDRRAAKVERGENRGRYLTYRNVVRDIEKIARWHGEPLTVSVPIPRRDGDGETCAVLVQASESGRILGAARMPLVGGN